MDDLRRIDLNLLLALYALLSEKHVSRAAERIYRSQPALSHSLNLLRQHFNDPLLVRQGSKMTLTPKAESLLYPLEQALAQLNGLLKPEPFDPAASQVRFRLAMSDYASAIILPPLSQQLRQQAPNIGLAISQANRTTMLLQLQEGQIDFAFSPFDPKQLPENIEYFCLFEEHFIGVTDHANLPKDPDNWQLTDWLNRPHILVDLQTDRTDEIRQTLAEQGYPLQPMLTLPHWNNAIKLLPHTDFVLTIASKMAQDLTAYPRLRRFSPPLPLPSLNYYVVWHKRQTHNQAHRWLREQIIQVSKG